MGSRVWVGSAMGSRVLEGSGKPILDRSHFVECSCIGCDADKW